MASKEQAKASCPPDITVVLIGTLGSGKSHTGNTIIGCTQFPHECGTLPVTTAIETYHVNIPDPALNLTVIDTPGFQTHDDFEIINKIHQTHKCSECVYLFVIRVGRYQNYDRSRLEGFFKTRKDISHKTGIVLTCAAEICVTGQTIDQWLLTTPSLQKLIKDNRLDYVAIENVNVDEESKGKHRKKLLALIAELFMHDSNKSIKVTKEQLKEYFGHYGVMFFREIEKQQSGKTLFRSIFGTAKSDPRQ